MIRIEVIVRGTEDIRDDVANWDKYGAAEALDTEMTKFDVSFFTPQSGTSAAFSLVNANYSWNVIFSSNEQKYPIINFYDNDSNSLVGQITGNPVKKNDVYALLKDLVSSAADINTYSQTSTTTTAAQRQQKAQMLGFGLIGLLAFLFLRVKK